MMSAVDPPVGAFVTSYETATLILPSLSVAIHVTSTALTPLTFFPLSTAASAAERRASGTSQAYGVMGQSMSQLGQGVSGIVGSVGDFIGAQYDAAMKEMEADQERMRASRDALKSINDSLSELIQKSISTQDAIQQNMNQTRSRILG